MIGSEFTRRAVRRDPSGPLPHRLPRPLRPSPVVVLTADTIFAHLGEDLTGRRQAFGIDPPVGIPQVGSDDRAGTLKIDLINRHDDDRARRLAVDLERSQQVRIG